MSGGATMAIRLNTDRVSFGRVQYAGEVVELPIEEARRLVADRQAEPVSAQPETASVAPPIANAAIPRPRTTRRPHA